MITFYSPNPVVCNIIIGIRTGYALADNPQEKQE